MLSWVSCSEAGKGLPDGRKERLMKTLECVTSGFWEPQHHDSGTKPCSPKTFESRKSKENLKVAFWVGEV